MDQIPQEKSNLKGIITYESVLSWAVEESGERRRCKLKFHFDFYSAQAELS